MSENMTQKTQGKEANNITENRQSLLGSEESVREALTRIWITQQRNETNNSLEEEFNNDSPRSKETALRNRLEEYQDPLISITRSSVILDKREKMPRVNTGSYERDSLLTSRLQEDCLLKNHTNTRCDAQTVDCVDQENSRYSRVKFDSKLEPIDTFDNSSEVCLRLPYLAKSPVSLSRQSSNQSNDSSPNISPSLSPRTRFSRSLPRNVQGPDFARSLPGSPLVMRRIMAKRSSDLTCHLERPVTVNTSLSGSMQDIADAHRQQYSHAHRKRRPDTPMTRDLNNRRIAPLSRSCSELNLISETSPVQPSKRDKHRLFPDILKWFASRNNHF